MNRPAPRTFTVLGKHPVTPRMLRVSLGGEGLESFPDDQASAYVKLMFPVDGRERPLLRTYTVRAQRSDAIDIDFALHGADGGGPASGWALNCQPGDRIDIGGPGPKKLADAEADFVLMVGDMTALPAISVNLEQLPASAQGRVIVEVPHEEDIQPLSKPERVDLQWVINPTPGQATPLVEAVAALAWPHGRVAVWAACEFTSMRALREHFRHERGVERTDMYISSYWKQGSDEDNHKSLKRADAEADGNA
ncbi:siderophore-interacting protein [Oleiagrimonas sp. C23AA]|uniref:siderophore-interacting protein n=1 Tax=Oleiagrimonas sp. C23AA TaxID=2719047 RepID=UPI0014229690|nr:siderophore-interacting protein [Oleiagrimonas sp. C23AA]NII09879.1 siderophore-interacting protein [Oleiagrimonas sp. C23AA]